MSTPTEATTRLTLRLAERLLTLLSTTDTPQAADLARTVSADPTGIALDTLEQVSGLFRIPPAHFFKEHAA